MVNSGVIILLSVAIFSHSWFLLIDMKLVLLLLSSHQNRDFRKIKHIVRNWNFKIIGIIGWSDLDLTGRQLFRFAALVEPLLLKILITTWLKSYFDSAKPARFLKAFLNNVSKAAFSFKSGHLTKFNQIDHKVLFAAF